MGNGSRVTRGDVASAAGVSTAVVSYVVNDGPRAVSKQARERVLRAIQELGYRPNAAARALTKGSSGIYGLVMPETMNPYFAQVAHFAVEAAATAGVELMMMHEVGVVDSVLDRIMRLPVGQVDGLMIASVFTEAEEAKIAQLDMHVVLLNQFRPPVGLSAFGMDLRDAARLGTEHLLMHGRAGLAFLGGAHPADPRIAGWRDAIATVGADERLVLQSGFSIDAAYDAIRQADLGGVDGILVASDQQAWGVLSALRSRGVSVPDDIAVVGLDGIAQAAYFDPPLTTVAEPTEAIIAAALAELMAEERPEPALHRYPPSLVRRVSCGCR